MKQSRPLRAGDIVRLVNPEHGEPDGDCTVIADQDGGLVWFRSDEPASDYRGPCFVARRSALRLIRKVQP